MQPRVVITGIGLVTSLGQDVQIFWDRLLSGASGISDVESFDTSRFRVRRGGEVKSFQPEPSPGRCDPAVMGRTSRLAISAAAGALRDGGIDSRDELGDRWGVCIGTTSGEPREIEGYVDHLHSGGMDGAGTASTCSIVTRAT